MINLATAPRRILVVGSTSAGKTTLAGAISRHFGIPHIEMDSLYWDASWTPAPLEVFRQRVRMALASDEWVADGNYRKVRDLSWERASMVVWLDYSMPVIMSRLSRRTFRRIVTREVLWNGNQECLREQFTRNSLFLWAVTTHRRRRRDYETLMSNLHGPEREFVRFRRPSEAAVWMREMVTGCAAPP